MKQLSRYQIENLSFPDEDVVDFNIDTTMKSLLILLNGGYVDEKDKGHHLRNVEIQIEKISDANVFSWDSDKKQKTNHSLSEGLTLREICDFVVKNDNVQLKGFCKESGKWIEFHLKSNRISVYAASDGE